MAAHITHKKTMPASTNMLAATVLFCCLQACAQAHGGVAIHVEPSARGTFEFSTHETVALKLRNSADTELSYYCGAEAKFNSEWREVLGSLDKNAPRNGVIVRKIKGRKDLSIAFPLENIDPDIYEAVSQFRVICHVRKLNTSPPAESVIRSNAFTVDRE